MMRLVFILLFSVNSASTEIEDLRQKLLFSVNNHEDFQYLDLNYRYLKVLKSECELQISTKNFPQSCYLAQKRFEELGLDIDKSLNPTQFDRSCHEVVQKVYSLAILQNLENMGFVSEICKEFIRVQVRKLKYILGT